MARRPQYSRWRRLPGVYRISEKKGPDPKSEPQRLTLYLPEGVLDRAETQATRQGAESIQKYCEDLLLRAIEAEDHRERVEVAEARRGPLEGWDAIANDPEYLAEWTASAASHDRPVAIEATSPRDVASETTFEPGLPAPIAEKDDMMTRAVEVVFRHAAVGIEDASAFLPTLRRGEAIGSVEARELLQALRDLEAECREVPRLDRRLAYALHRLAFEGQILLTEAWSGTQADETTVDVLRLVQEAVDRILSGEDIRYFPRGPAPADLP